jgi:hypothetical protein
MWCALMLGIVELLVPVVPMLFLRTLRIRNMFFAIVHALA